MTLQFDEMTNPELVAAVGADETASDLEIELAHRLENAYQEIEILAGMINDLEAKHGLDA